MERAAIQSGQGIFHWGKNYLTWSIISANSILYPASRIEKPVTRNEQSATKKRDLRNLHGDTIEERQAMSHQL